jgi:hypothetical protein
LTEWIGAAVPVPLRLAVFGVLAAVLAKEAVADAAPDEPGAKFTVNVTGWVVVTVTGNVRPLIENSEGFAPLKLTEVTETLAPVALSVPVCVPVVPTTTLPALTAVALRVPWLCVTAVPLRVTLRAGFVASESIMTLPLTLPADLGAKVTLKEALCPGVRINGVVSPEMLKPEPETVAWEMVEFVPPVFRTVSVCDWVWPTCTLVNVRFAGVALSVAGATPIPDRAKSSVVLDPLTEIERVLLAAPTVAGVKTTAKLVL